MKVLVVGGGGREHAIVWKLSKSNVVDKIYCAPGNAGIAKIAHCIDINPENSAELIRFAKSEGIGLTIVGPEAPLVAGLADEFTANNLKIFGPDRMCSAIEGSKIFCKNLLRKYLIPTAPYKVFYKAESALNSLKASSYPVVIKADGLCQGKGVFVCRDKDEAEQRVIELMEKESLGPAGTQIVIEDYLEGEEVSVLGVTDGYTVIVFEPARDYKRIYSGDRGPNTGGMGGYSPVPYVTPQQYRQISNSIFAMLIHALNREQRVYKGILYAGLMLTCGGPKVLEFNVRLGDPEAQVLLPRMECDFAALALATIDRKLLDVNVGWSPKRSVAVVIASGGYPGKYETGFKVSGIDDPYVRKEVNVFVSGLSSRNGDFHTSGGRIMTIQALGDTFTEARSKVYNAVNKISFKNSYFRDDIAAKLT